MRCPICKRETPPGENPYRPFCSERCKLVDLDNWLSGRYRIPERQGSDGGRASPAEELEGDVEGGGSNEAHR